MTAVVRCGGDNHRVTWRRGKLVLEDHDLGAERTMLVFGGEPCVCMQVLKMWDDQFGMPPELFGNMPRWLGASAFLAPPEFDLVRELGMVLSWERAWRHGSYLTKHERLLESELRERATGPLREHLVYWKQQAGVRVLSAADVTVVRSDQRPHLTGSIDRVSIKARAALKATWPVEVWARNIALVGDAFVLEVLEAPRPNFYVRAASWGNGGGGGGFLPVEGNAWVTAAGDGGWRLEWDGTGTGGRVP